jgi:hypothetical protein
MTESKNDTTTGSEQRRDQAIAAMRQAPGKPVAGNGQPIGQQTPGQRTAVYNDARNAASLLEQIGDEVDEAARLYRSECQRLAEEYRRLTDAFLVRLIGPRK